MFTIKRLNSRGQNAAGQDVVEYLLNTDIVEYYDADGNNIGTPTSRFSGAMAAELGLVGVTPNTENMMALAQGFAPDGTALCKNAGAKPTIEVKRKKDGEAYLRADGTEMTLERGGHRVGFDMTFSAPKSLGILYMMGDDDMRRTIQECMMEAAEVGSQFAEKQIETRRGTAGIDVIKVDKTIRSMHFHEASRNLEPMPHVHNLWFNVCVGEDGEPSTYDAQQLFRWRHATDMVSLNHLATIMRERTGISFRQIEHIDVHGKRSGRKSWEVEGLHDRDLIESVSSRHREIMEERAKGTSDAEAWAKTRKHKDEPSHVELMDHFQNLKADLSTRFNLPSLEQLKGMTDHKIEARNEADLLKFLHEKMSIIDQPTLLKHIGMENIGFMSSGALLAEFERFKSSENIIGVNPMAVHEDDLGQKLSTRHTDFRYAARWMLDTELRFVEQSKAREQEVHLQVAKSTADDAVDRVAKIKGFRPSAEQYNAIMHATVESKGIAVVPGFAGTGKTATSDFIKAVFEADGRTLIGCAVSTGAAEKLNSETGIECRSVSMTLSMIKKGALTLNDKTVVVLDESGMINIHQSQELAQRCKDRGAKLLVQGDTRQLQPVGAGMGMSLLEDILPTAELTEIRRQKKEEDRRIAAMFYDVENGKRKKRGAVLSTNEVREKSNNIFDELEARGCIEEYSVRDDGMHLLVEEYMSRTVPHSEFLIMTHTLADLKEVNTRIRDARKLKGEVTGKEATFKAIGKEEFFDISLAQGDLISFTTNDKVMGVINGTKAVVTGVEEDRRKGGFTITCTSESDGREIVFNTHEWKAVKLAYARTVHDAQGQGMSKVRLWGNGGMSDVSSIGVAFSRMTGGDFKWYMSTDERDSIRDNLARERFTENILQSGVTDQEINAHFNALKKPKPEIDVEDLLPKIGRTQEPSKRSRVRTQTL